MPLGQRLRQARELRGMTQEQVAVAAGMPPDGRATVQIIESRDSNRTKYAGPKRHANYHTTRPKNIAAAGWSNTAAR